MARLLTVLIPLLLLAVAAACDNSGPAASPTPVTPTIATPEPSPAPPVGPTPTATPSVSQDDIAGDIQEQLPPDAEISEIVKADVTGSGQEETIVTYTATFTGGYEAGDLAILGETGQGQVAVFVSDLLGREYGVSDFPSQLIVEDINRDSKMEIVSTWFGGAHGSSIVVLTWDGTAYEVVFETGSNTPGIQINDLTGDGVKEIVVPVSTYFPDYASAPTFPAVYAWDGTQYLEIYGPFDPGPPHSELIADVLALAGQDLDPFARYYLGRAYEMKGLRSEALAEYETALSQQQDSALGEELQSAIARTSSQ